MINDKQVILILWEVTILKEYPIFFNPDILIYYVIYYNNH